MNFVMVEMLASQLGIPPEVIAEVKASKLELVAADFDNIGVGYATLTVRVVQPKNWFPVTITLPLDQLKRVKPLYDKAVKLAHQT